jgi:hypothetical protein
MIVKADKVSFSINGIKMDSVIIDDPYVDINMSKEAIEAWFKKGLCTKQAGKKPTVTIRLLKGTTHG